GKVSNYLVKKFGFNLECVVVAFVGDNPASLAGLAPEQGDVVVSLGTSDTVFLWLTKPTPGLSGHIFANPINQDDFMSLTCLIWYHRAVPKVIGCSSKPLWIGASFPAFENQEPIGRARAITASLI
ncbi:hypothetical protein RRG08_066127, partial [Elysia crispata]